MDDRPPIPPITNFVPIVKPDGTPTPFFIQYLKERGIDIDSGLTPEDVNNLINQWSATRQIIAGTGLGGGGTLDANVSLHLNAVLNDLNDVDTVSTPPTDGQALVYNATSGLWLPGTVSGGGGGGGSWELVASVPITSSVSSVPVTGLSGAEDILVIARSVTASTSGRRAIQVSTDNGATYYNSNGDYPYTQIDGVEAGVAPYTSLAVMHEVTSTGARTSYAYIPGAGVTGSPKVIMPFAGQVKYLFTASPDPINAIRVINSGGGNLTGGDVYVYKRTSGGSGGGGQPWWFDPPAASSFSISSPSGTLTLTDDADVGMLAAISNAGVNHFAYRTLADKSQDWDMIARMEFWGTSGNYNAFCVAIKDSVGGRMHQWGLTSNQQITRQNMTNQTTWSSSPYAANAMAGSVLPWWRIRSNGSNLEFYASSNGKAWILTGTVAATSWLANRADQVGFMFLQNSAGSSVAVQNFELTGPAV